jgi:hypothetical protein
MLFNLSEQLQFPNNGKGEAIWCDKKMGPLYGYNELSAFREPFNYEENCCSDSGNECYEIPEEYGENTLTN